MIPSFELPGVLGVLYESCVFPQHNGRHNSTRLTVRATLENIPLSKYRYFSIGVPSMRQQAVAYDDWSGPCAQIFVFVIVVHVAI